MFTLTTGVTTSPDTFFVFSRVLFTRFTISASASGVIDTTPFWSIVLFSFKVALESTYTFPSLVVVKSVFIATDAVSESASSTFGFDGSDGVTGVSDSSPLSPLV